MKKTKPLAKERRKIDSIDKRMILLLSKRIRMAKKLRKIKKKNRLKTTDRAREREVIQNARAMAQQHDIEPGFAENIFKKIIKYMKEQQR